MSVDLTLLELAMLLLGKDDSKTDTNTNLNIDIMINSRECLRY